MSAASQLGAAAGELVPDALQGGDGAPGPFLDPQVFYTTGDKAGSAPAGSSKVGWTLRQNGKTIAAFDFLINPQGLVYTDGGRGQLEATKGGFYVDDFGPGASTIQLRQLVAHGQVLPDGRFYTAKEDVQRFLTLIYLPALARSGDGLQVFFHDNHFERGFARRVYFPPNSLQTSRSVENPNIFAIDLQMIGLDKYPYATVQAKPHAANPVARRRTYVVKKGDTIDKLVRRLAGKHATVAKRKRIRKQLLDLNPKLTKKRLLADGHTIGKPHKVYPGEQIRLPKAS